VNRARSARKPRDSVAGRLVLCALAYEELVGGGAACDVVSLAEEALANDELLHSEGPGCAPMYRAIVAVSVCDELERTASALTRAMARARRLGSPTAFAWASAWRCAANTRLGRLLDAEADGNAALGSGDQYLSGYGLIWGSGCQELTVGSSLVGCGGSAEGAAGLAGARRVVRLIFAGWVPQDQVSS